MHHRADALRCVHAALLLAHVPDAVFAPLAAAIMTALAPILLARHDEATARRRHAAEGRASVTPTPRRAAMLQLYALLLAIIVPLLLAAAWKPLEPLLALHLGGPASAVRAALAPRLAPLTAALDAATEGLLARVLPPPR